MTSLAVFSVRQELAIKLHLAGKVAAMMGRKWEEGDWSEVYCAAKGIPDAGWSNLNIDVNHEGIGVEFKMLRVPRLGDDAIEKICGTTLMHPSATRSIRIADLNIEANDAMRDVFQQYTELIEARTTAVRDAGGGETVDMRVGWLLWETKLREFLYWEEPMVAPTAGDYYAQWNERPAMGARKASKSLWIYDRTTRLKRYSVTTSAGIKIQPYFDVPAPDDPHLYRFRVQSEPVGLDAVLLWVTPTTASELAKHADTADKDAVSELILRLGGSQDLGGIAIDGSDDRLSAVPVEVSQAAYECLGHHWAGVNDDHSIRLFLRTFEQAS